MAELGRAVATAAPLWDGEWEPVLTAGVCSPRRGVAPAASAHAVSCPDACGCLSQEMGAGMEPCGDKHFIFGALTIHP